VLGFVPPTFKVASKAAPAPSTPDVSGWRRAPSVLLTAKKKKGPAANFDLDALEAMEASLYDKPPKTEESSAEAEDKATTKAAKKAKKEAKAAAAAAAGVGEGGEEGGPVGEVDSVAAALALADELDAAEYAAGNGSKKKKKEKRGQGSGAVAERGASEVEASAEDELELLMGGGKKSKQKDKKDKKDKKKDKKSKIKKGAHPEEEEEEEKQAVAEAPPVVAVEEEEVELSLEERVRKSRPAPRVQIAESSQPGYVSMRLDGVSVVFKNQEVLKDATWEVKTGDRVGLVGANGCGKTTMVKILAGDLDPTSGDVVKSSKDLRVAFLRQEFSEDIDLSRTLREEFASVFKEAQETLAALAAAEGALEGMAAGDDMQAVLDDLATLQEKADRLEAYGIEGKVDRVLVEMGFMPEEADALVASFSGGWKMRVGLGKILLQDPNILLLDEVTRAGRWPKGAPVAPLVFLTQTLTQTQTLSPTCQPTNHLDLESVEWLEKFLQEQNIPMVIVSHDREFMDQVKSSCSRGSGAAQPGCCASVPSTAWAAVLPLAAELA